MTNEYLLHSKGQFIVKHHIAYQEEGWGWKCPKIAYILNGFNSKRNVPLSAQRAVIGALHKDMTDL